jgi:hypothetical protein
VRSATTYLAEHGLDKFFKWFDHESVRGNEWGEARARAAAHPHHPS